MLVIIK